jgi:hypothetical protein
LNKFIENLWGNHEWTIQREKKQHLTQDTQWRQNKTHTSES